MEVVSLVKKWQKKKKHQVYQVVLTIKPLMGLVNLIDFCHVIQGRILLYLPVAFYTHFNMNNLT